MSETQPTIPASGLKLTNPPMTQWRLVWMDTPPTTAELLALLNGLQITYYGNDLPERFGIAAKFFEIT